MDEKFKSETCKIEQFSVFTLYYESNRAGRCRERRYADHIFIQIDLYFRRAFHHFVVNFSNDPLNQNAADVPACSGYSVTGRNPHLQHRAPDGRGVTVLSLCQLSDKSMDYRSQRNFATKSHVIYTYSISYVSINIPMCCCMQCTIYTTVSIILSPSVL